MQDVLSQQEIDLLLDNLSSGDVSAESIREEQKEKKVTSYDFRRPNRFSKEQVRTLEMMHENFARILSTFLSAHLRTMVEVKLLSVQELSYDEFTRSLMNPTVMTLVKIEDLKGEMVLELNPILAFSIIDRLLGGTGDAHGEQRGLTEIEQVIIFRLVNQILKVLDDAWKHVVPIKGQIQRLETNPQFVQMVAGNEMVALVSLEVAINGAKGLLNLCLPYIILKPVTGKLSARYWFSKSEQEELPEEGRRLLQRRLSQAYIPVMVEVGRTSISTGDLLHLQVDDVIILDKRATGQMDIFVGSRPKFKGRPGVTGEKLAVEITAIGKEEEGDG